MLTEVPKGVSLFIDNDDGFIRWCESNPNGFFWNCYRTRAGDSVRPKTLHAANPGGKWCPHFRNRNRAERFEPNLTKGRNCKVCSVDRRALEDWAKNASGLRRCSDCISLP